MGVTEARDELAIVVERTFTEGIADGLSAADCADVIVGVIREQLMASVENNLITGKADNVGVQSIIGASTGEPYVQLSVGVEQWRWSVETAREHAYVVLQCAEAATLDAAVLRWATLGALGLKPEQAAVMIHELRRFRGDIDPKDWRKKK